MIKSGGYRLSDKLKVVISLTLLLMYMAFLVETASTPGGYAAIVRSTDINPTPTSTRAGTYRDNVRLTVLYDKPAATRYLFDTGESSDPYPSIAGTHYGTITPFTTLHNVAGIYVYPCPGTGGHAEYVAIYYDSNRTDLIREGSWTGYNSLYISFEPFTMYANHTYYYKILTGSYPQIHHNSTCETANGTINCSEFIDVNGRVHKDWIPAIRLISRQEQQEKRLESPKLTFTALYRCSNISVEPRVPHYHLPLNPDDISNFDAIINTFNLTDGEKEQLQNEGMLILDCGNVWNGFTAPYEYLITHNIPIFITSDTMLHLYHVQFNELLQSIEEREFYDELVDMSEAMFERSVQDYNSFEEPDLREAARRNVAYFSVALSLLQTPTEGYNGDEELKEINFSIPDYVKDEVETELINIKKHGGIAPGAIFNTNTSCSCLEPCCYCEDYSQYVPRGHYTQNEKLRRYFKAMMWYGRMAFLLKGCDGGEALISERDANISTIQAALIASELPVVKIGNETAGTIWGRIYAVTSFFVGEADDLTPYEYESALINVFGGSYNLSHLSEDTDLLMLKAELAKMRNPEIYGGSGVCVVYPPVTRAKLYKCLSSTKGMRFMGQRFVPDSYIFQQLVSPAVGLYAGNDSPFTMCDTDLGPARCFPRGLDVMAVLGSERAEDILREEGDTEYMSNDTSYDMQLDMLKSQFDTFDITDWNRNLYWSWLYTLKPLLKEWGEGYPTFMQTEAWQDKELHTSLASWTELRHDTILYAKQSYTPVLKSVLPVHENYVEPVPEFYARLLALTQMTENGLSNLGVLNETERARLRSLECALSQLINISVKELKNEELTAKDYQFLLNIGEELDSIVAGVCSTEKETTLVADVHTDANTDMVLEEGVGYVNLLMVAYRLPDGRIIVGAGPVFSYYEFKQPMEQRLTDNLWKKMLNTSSPPEEPLWFREHVSSLHRGRIGQI